MVFDKIVTVEYRTVSGNFGNYNYVPDPNFTFVPVNIQPIIPTFMENNGISLKTYRIYTTNSGIVEGMRLTVSGTGETYIVNGRQRFDYVVAPHFELIAEDES